MTSMCVCQQESVLCWCSRHVRFQQAVEPRQQVLGAVVRVEDHRHAILLRHGPHVVRAGHGARDGGVELRVVQALPRIEPRADVNVV